MKEAGIDISTHSPKSLDQFLSLPFDYVVTVCDNAKEQCPVFSGDVKHRLHIGFDDPAEAFGTDEEVTAEFRRVRDEIRAGFKKFYTEAIEQE
jgi:arsenate reductase